MYYLFNSADSDKYTNCLYTAYSRAPYPKLKFPKGPLENQIHIGEWKYEYSKHSLYNWITWIQIKTQKFWCIEQIIEGPNWGVSPIRWIYPTKQWWNMHMLFTIRRIWLAPNTCLTTTLLFNSYKELPSRKNELSTTKAINIIRRHEGSNSMKKPFEQSEMGGMELTQ